MELPPCPPTGLRVDRKSIWSGLAHLDVDPTQFIANKWTVYIIAAQINGRVGSAGKRRQAVDGETGNQFGGLSCIPRDRGVTGVNYDRKSHISSPEYGSHISD